MSNRPLRDWASFMEYHFDTAEDWLRKPPDEGTVAIAMAHATLANAAATRLLECFYHYKAQEKSA